MMIVTNYSQFFSIFFLLCRLVSPDKDTTDLFIDSPGDGEEFVYSPVGVNATLRCAVSSTILTWFIDDRLTFESLPQKFELHARGIYQSGPTLSTDGITVSSVTVYGDSENNNIRICCQLFVIELKENCTTVIIYDRPLPPTQVSVQAAGGVNLLNISWTATTMTGVNQTYIIVFDAHTIETTYPHHIFYQEITSADPMGNCGLFLAFVKAVNGAGESDPSNNVSIPSLPDIGPVTTSLTHQVWKHDGEIRANVSFQPAKFCLDYPVLRYILLLKETQTRQAINVSLQLDHNVTEVILGPEIGLEADQKYKYRVTAVNAIGNSTSHQDGIDLFTSDVQSVSATVVDESTIAIQCLFVHGSDALGCKVVLVSNCSNISDVYANFSRNNSLIMSASGKLSLAHNISCYFRVFAFDIDINNTISNLTIEGRIKLIANNEPADGGPLSIPIVAIPSILIPLILIMVVALSVALYKQRKYKKNSSVSKASCISRCLSGCACTKFLPAKFMEEDTWTPSIHTENDDYYCSKNNYEDNKCTIVTQPPLYSVPDKLKSKRALKSSDGKLESDHITSLPVEKSHDVKGLQTEEEHFYHILETSRNRAPCTSGVISSDPDAPELPPPLKSDSQDTATPPVYQDISQLSCEPCTSGVISSDPDALELPPTLKPDSQDTNTPPVYQDISQLSCEPIANNMADCDEGEQQLQQGEHNLVIDACKPSLVSLELVPQP